MDGLPLRESVPFCFFLGKIFAKQGKKMHLHKRVKHATTASNLPHGVVSKRVVLADVPPERKPERGYVRQNHPFTKPPFYLPITLFGVDKRVVSKRVVSADVPPERKPERGYVRQNHPFTKPPFYLPVNLEHQPRQAAPTYTRNLCISTKTFHEYL